MKAPQNCWLGVTIKFAGYASGDEGNEEKVFNAWLLSLRGRPVAFHAAGYDEPSIQLFLAMLPCYSHQTHVPWVMLDALTCKFSAR